MSERAVLFIDGNNWYHGLKAAGVTELRQLDYVKIAEKLVGPRAWLATRYYIGRVQQLGNTKLYAEQRAFLASLTSADARITVHLGRLESRRIKDATAEESLHYLARLSVKIDPSVYKDLVALGMRHKFANVVVEKAVDVMLAVDLVVMAERNEYDTAYVLSADGDYTHAVSFVRGQGKKVFAASASHGAHLAKAVDSFIHVDRGWFTGCYS